MSKQNNPLTRQNFTPTHTRHQLIFSQQRIPLVVCLPTCLPRLWLLKLLLLLGSKTGRTADSQTLFGFGRIRKFSTRESTVERRSATWKRKLHSEKSTYYTRLVQRRALGRLPSSSIPKANDSVSDLAHPYPTNNYPRLAPHKAGTTTTGANPLLPEPQSRYFLHLQPQLSLEQDSLNYVYCQAT